MRPKSRFDCQDRDGNRVSTQIFGLSRLAEIGQKLSFTIPIDQLGLRGVADDLLRNVLPSIPIGAPLKAHVDASKKFEPLLDALA